MMESFTIRTPASSANIGPGFDVIGLALSLYLELKVTINRSKQTSDQPLNCRITYEGEGVDDVPLDPSANLITRVALYVLRCHDQRAFPIETHVHIVNPIPLGRGLGSSGAAVVAGVMLGKQVGGLDHLDEKRLFDFCLMIGKSPTYLPTYLGFRIYIQLSSAPAPPPILAIPVSSPLIELFFPRATSRQRGRCSVRWVHWNLP